MTLLFHEEQRIPVPAAAVRRTLSWPVLAIDPGNDLSAWCLYLPAARRLALFAKVPNADLLGSIEQAARREGYPFGEQPAHLAVEMIASYGMPVGREVFETCVWIGRFVQAWGGPHTLVYRRDVKLHLCGTSTAKDPNVRQALIDRFGPGKDRAVGKKASPGPLYGVSNDVWSALAIAVTYAERGGQPK